MLEGPAIDTSNVGHWNRCGWEGQTQVVKSIGNAQLTVNLQGCELSCRASFLSDPWEAAATAAAVAVRMAALV
jgi:hypothetical protein